MGDVVCLMMVIPVITFIKGNAKSGDTLISCFGGQNCIARVPRMCLCGKVDLDNLLHRCLWISMAYQRELNEKVAQLLVPPETRPGKPPESCHQRRAWEKEMKEYMATLDAMSAHHCDNAFFEIKFRSQSIWHYPRHSTGHDAIIQVRHSQTCLPNIC
jgi:hypothetical protein